MRHLFTGGLIVLITLTSGCGKKHPPEVYDALASLRKVQAATQVGVNYQQYNLLLIDAKDKANAASRVLSDGPLKTEIQAAMDAYADAGQVWREKVKSTFAEVKLDPQLISKYSLKRNMFGETDTDEALPVIWLNANLHLTKLAELLPEHRN